MALANHLASKGPFGEHQLFRFLPGVPLGEPATTQTMALFKTIVPAGGQWAAFGIGRHGSPMLAQAMVLGGHVRVGFEDNLYISKGVLANSNAELVERAAQIVRLLSSEIASPDDVRRETGRRAPGANRFITIDLHTSFLKPGQRCLVAEGRRIGGGRSIVFCEGEILDEVGDVVARASGLFKPVTPRP